MVCLAHARWFSARTPLQPSSARVKLGSLSKDNSSRKFSANVQLKYIYGGPKFTAEIETLPHAQPQPPHAKLKPPHAKPQPLGGRWTCSRCWSLSTASLSSAVPPPRSSSLPHSGQIHSGLDCPMSHLGSDCPLPHSGFDCHLPHSIFFDCPLPCSGFDCPPPHSRVLSSVSRWFDYRTIPKLICWVCGGNTSSSGLERARVHQICGP